MGPFTDPARVQVVHSLLSRLNKLNHPTTIMFKSIYRRYFNMFSVPPVEDYGDFVKVDRLKAIEYLKSTYNFYSKEERAKILQDEAKARQT